MMIFFFSKNPNADETVTQEDTEREKKKKETPSSYILQGSIFYCLHLSDGSPMLLKLSPMAYLRAPSALVVVVNIL